MQIMTKSWSRRPKLLQWHSSSNMHARSNYVKGSGNYSMTMTAVINIVTKAPETLGNALTQVVVTDSGR